MFQSDADPIATSIPFFVNGTEFLSLNREDDPRRNAEGATMHRLFGGAAVGCIVAPGSNSAQPAQMSALLRITDSRLTSVHVRKVPKNRTLADLSES